MMHRAGRCLLIVLTVGIAIATGTIATGADAPANRPNIVFILADDLGYGDLGCYNRESKIPTPNCDRLASEGIRFTDAHSPSAVCTPTRYGVLTGRYSWRTTLKRGVLQGYDPLLIEPGRMTVASLLKQQGYATAAFGKWHLGLGDKKPTDYDRAFAAGPNTVGFDYFFGIPSSLDFPPYVFVENDSAVERPTATIASSKMRREGGGGFWRAGGIAPSFQHEDVLPAITDKAVEFIRTQSSGKPFFVYFPLSAPHTPWMPTAEFRGKSKAGYYGDFVAQIDATIGRVLSALDERSLTDRTLVIVTSDNGAHWLASDIKQFGHRANGALRGQKADLWEGGHRVPFIARWPGRIKPGTTSDETICLTDLLRTVAAIADVSLPANAGEDSCNLLPALLGTAASQPIREATVHQSGDGTLAIRQGPWKLCTALGSHGFTEPRSLKPKPGEPEGQLYNLADDPAEQTNLWSERPEVVARLTALLEQYQAAGRSAPSK
jgi:arylsulfatase A-like enzyme